MIEMLDIVHGMREGNKVLGATLDHTEERLAKQEVEITRLRMLMDKITSQALDFINKNKFCRSVVVSVIVYCVVLFVAMMFQHGSLVGSSKLYELM